MTNTINLKQAEKNSKIERNRGFKDLVRRRDVFSK